LCYVPCLSDDANVKELRFALYEYGDALHVNRFGILEPAHPKVFLSPSALQVVLTPVLAFDSLGHRLGTGGGYYDTTFSFVKEIPTDKPIFLGVGYAVQQAEQLPEDEWDVKLDFVLTEKECFSV